MEILLIEDDPDLAGLISEYLETEGMRCENAFTGTLGLQLAKDNQAFDCIVLDLNLPMLDGLSICRILREEGCSTPVIMVTARTDIEEKLEGFASGADDYLCKPFEMRELIARIKALAQRRSRASVLQCENLTMDLVKKCVLRGGREIALSNTEWKILRILLTSSPGAVHRARIVHEIWGNDPPGSDSLKVHIHNLRKAVDFLPERPLIHTVAGVGYALY